MRYTLKPSVPDLRDHIYTRPHTYQPPKAASLAVKVPYRAQGKEGSCGGFATTSARAAIDLKRGHAYTEYSPAFAYYWARYIEGDVFNDGGSTIQDEMKAIVQYGACPATLMPYVPGLFADAPSAEANAAAAENRAIEYFRVPHIGSMANIKAAIEDGLPIIIGIAVYQSFEDAAGQGRIPLPANGEAMLGGHALYCHTVQDDKSTEGGGALIGDNSWGNSAPFALPYAYVQNTRLCFEVRTFKA